MGKLIADRIKILRLSLGLNQTEFGERLGTTQATVSRWEKGSVPDSDKLTQLAEIAGLSIEEFLSDRGRESSETKLLSRFWVRGVVAAGVFELAYEWPEDQWVPYSGRTDIDVPEKLRFGLRVKGDSMNLRYPEDTILDCVSVYGLSDLRSGQFVIVERESTTGEVEATVKEYVLGEDGTHWLVPHSTNPKYQAPISIENPGEGVLEARVTAKVVGSYRPEPLA